MRAMLALPLLALGLAATTPTPGDPAVRFGARVSPTVSLRLWVPAGEVRLEPWDRDSVEATGSVGQGAHFFGGGSGAGVKLGVERDDPLDGHFASATLVVRVPRQARVWIKMADGRVLSNGMGGELEVISIAGRIDLRNGEGVVAVETIDAAVDVHGLRGALRLNGGSGAVRLSGIVGTATVNTVSGAVDLDAGRLQDGRVTTIGGAIVTRGTLEPKATIELETHDGPMTLGMVKGAPLPALLLSSRSGKVTNPFRGIVEHRGQIIARSFRGDINVVPVSGIEGRKPSFP